MNKNVRNSEIELIRGVACILVIMAHGQLFPFENGELCLGRLLPSVIIPDNVPLFMIITGFFFFSKVESITDIFHVYATKVRDFILKIYLPAIFCILVSIIYNFFDPHITTALGIRYDINYLTDFIIHFKANDHLWYIFAHMNFIISFPLFALLCRNNPKTNWIRRILLAITLIFFVLIDIEYYHQLNLFDEDMFKTVYNFVYLICGYELSLILPTLQDAKRSNHQNGLLLSGCILYLISFILKCILHINMFTKYGITDSHFKWNSTSLCITSSIGLFLFLYSFKSQLSDHPKISYIINWFGSKTFYIFLFHKLVTNELTALGYRDRIINLFNNCTTLGTSLGFYLIFDTTVLGITIILIMPFYYASRYIQRVLSKRH